MVRAVHEVALYSKIYVRYQGADKSLARPGRKQATATEDFEFHISYLKS
jgi:hypothetical protein